MANFTPVVHGTDVQDVQFVNEIVKSWSERRQAILNAPALFYVWDVWLWQWKFYIPTASACTAISDISVGDDIQKATFVDTAPPGGTRAVGWATIQDWVASYCAYYLKTSLMESPASTEYTWGQGGPAPDYNRDPWYDFGSLCTEAGISPSGFRRATVWPTDWTNLNDSAFTLGGGGGFGTMITGDIIGPWIFDDLQKVFKKLKYVMGYYSGSGYLYNGADQYDPYSRSCGASSSSFPNDCDIIRTAALLWEPYHNASAWEVASWGAGSTFPNGFANSMREKYSGGTAQRLYWGWSSYRVKAKASTSNIPSISDVDYKWKFHLVGAGDGYSNETAAINQGRTNGMLRFDMPYEDGSGSGTTLYTTKFVQDDSNVDTSPIEVDLEMICPFPAGAGVTEKELWYISQAVFTFEWNFTYSS